jgi:plasmid stabilization system protein ParE
MTVFLTAEAKLDLLRIGDYIAKDNPARAVSFVQELREATMQLDRLHALYPVIPRYQTQRIRRRIHGNYLVFFRVDEKQVMVLRILHGAMDLDSLLT